MAQEVNIALTHFHYLRTCVIWKWPQKLTMIFVREKDTWRKQHRIVKVKSEKWRGNLKYFFNRALCWQKFFLLVNVSSSVRPSRLSWKSESRSKWRFAFFRSNWSISVICPVQFPLSSINGRYIHSQISFVQVYFNTVTRAYRAYFSTDNKFYIGLAHSDSPLLGWC